MFFLVSVHPERSLSLLSLLRLIPVYTISSYSFLPHLSHLRHPCPHTHVLPGPGVPSPVSHPSSLQRLWQACRSSAPPCAVTVWAPEIVTPAPPPLLDTTSSPIAKVRAHLHSSLLPRRSNTSPPSSSGSLISHCGNSSSDYSCHPE